MKKQIIEFLQTNYTVVKNVVTGVVTITYPERRDGDPLILDEGVVDDFMEIIEHELNHIVSPRTMKRLILASATDFHPLIDLYNNLPDWDGVDYLDQVVRAMNITRISAGNIIVENPAVDITKDILSDWLCKMYNQVLNQSKYPKNQALTFVTTGSNNFRVIRNIINCLAPKVLNPEGYIRTAPEYRKTLNQNFILCTDPVCCDKAIRSKTVSASLAGCVVYNDAPYVSSEHIFIHVSSANFTVESFNVLGLASQIKSLIKNK